MACGPLLRLRYFGGDDRALEFWCNLTKEAAHELGWCLKNDKKLEPPEVVVERSPDCRDKLAEFLSNAKSVPSEMLNGVSLAIKLILVSLNRDSRILIDDLSYRTALASPRG